MNLVLVESPTKSKTLKKFLGKDFQVLPTYGHIRDLPQRKFGVDLENDFKPQYIILKKAKKIIPHLRELSKKCNMVYLATDPDREGEKIALDLVEVLKIPETKYQRIVFHEISKRAIEESLKHPRKLDLNLVSAQEARRILDRIVGYKLSPFLWEKVAKGLSAGRVQSIALRLICERERERENFKPQEYWTIEAQFEKKGKKFDAILVKKGEKSFEKFEISSKEKVEKILEDLKGAEFKVIKIERKETKRNPPPPFITSTMQQVAFQKFGWPAKKTMFLAQNLFEKGYITYHRTDSFNLSETALLAAKDFILKNFSEKYYQFRTFKTKSKLAQEAHEAIRPVLPEKKPENLKNELEKNQLKLYDLIWRRFIATQMKEAIFDLVKIDILAKDYLFRASGQTLKFDGFLKVYSLSFEEKEIPELEENEILKLIEFLPKQHFTQPPPRYTEATLIKELEKNGIGRPSTYAQIVSIIQERDYVRKDENKRFYPTEIGFLVNDLLVKHFPKIMEIDFTAKMEEDLDKIAQGKKTKNEILRGFYIPFEENLKRKYEEISKSEIVEKTGKKCPKCNSLLEIKISKFGKFYGCSRFPDCKYVEALENNETGVKCPKCGGKILKKITKSKKIFYGCENFPDCDFALWDEPINKSCSECGSLLIKTKKGKIKCSNKNCDFKEN